MTGLQAAPDCAMIEQVIKTCIRVSLDVSLFVNNQEGIHLDLKD
jgi:hypothetical protein